nr:LOW QUALITY PROTEIN: probable G-protein coupled receptor CG31760 [Cherax quadricarinatus]
MLLCGRGIVWVVIVVVLVGGVTHRPLRVRAVTTSQLQARAVTTSQQMDTVDMKERALKEASQLTTGNLGTICMAEPYYRFVQAPLQVPRFDSARQKADLLVRILMDLTRQNQEVFRTELLKLMMQNLLKSDEVISKARVLLHDAPSLHLISSQRRLSTYPPTDPLPKVEVSKPKLSDVISQPWYEDRSNRSWEHRLQQQRNPGSLGLWSYPYFECHSKRWYLTYTAVIPPSGTHSSSNTPDTRQCVFTPGYGWVRGGYKCECRKGYFPRNNGTFNGTLVEMAWESIRYNKNPIYQMYVCRRCPEDCPECKSDEPCNATYNWTFRIVLLTISSLCILFTIVLMGLVYHYRSVKVFRLASPTFLCICLIGCIIMYLEMAAIFPVLDTYSCVATKWTRHLGFCITFSSLLMKTWRVCFSVRKAESFFDEAKYISWAGYNIALVNIVMVTFHLLIFPKAGPDIKYLFGFLRTQLSTSTTVLFIFGPKFNRIVQGTGDQYDNRARAKGVTASFSLNGLGVMNDEPADLSQENEELKEEIQKLAAQMEFMKIVHMEMNNRHLKPKPGGYFSEKNSVINTAQSPGAKNLPPPVQAAKVSDASNENSSARLSPAAELASERV